MALYKTIYTNAGITKLNAAVATGVPILLTQMAVGDGNGNPVTPDPGKTSLVREMFRASLNRVFQNPDDPTRFTAELIVPATTGGFVMREIGVFDSAGSLLFVGNLPDTYKPTSSEGAFSDAVVRLEFIAANASVITLVIDPNTAVATHTWIINNVTAASLLPGGTTHQVLRKKTNADGDTEWVDPTDANVVVDMIEETQTLAASQTAVTLASTTTNGLAVYIEGVRLRSDQWTAVDATHLTLASSYPAGSKLIAIQNEPAGTIVFPLARNLNLSDVPDASAARTNLGVYSKAEVDQRQPAGMVGWFSGGTAPSGWLKANGAALSRTAYVALFAAIGTTYGAGDGFSTFNLPDMRGEFARGADDGRGVDSGRAIGSAQDWATAAPKSTSPSRITPTGTSGMYGGATNPSRVGFARASNSGDSTTTAGNDATQPSVGETDVFNVVTGDAETRPRNVALLACIKY